MPKSSYVYESGEAITVGSHGSHSYVYSSGDPVTDGGKSTTVYESGNGLGPIGTTIRLFDNAGTFLEELTIEKSLNGSVEGIGWHSGYQGNGGVFEYARLSDGTIIDSFEDGNITEYVGDTGRFNVSNSVPVKDGAYGLHSNPSDHANIRSSSGLNYYPTEGDVWRFWIYAYSGTERALEMRWGHDGSTAWTGGFGVNGDFQLKAPDGTNVVGNSYLQDGRWYEFEVDW